MHYYLSNGQQSRGPFALGELRAQGLTATSLVWHEQLPEWLPATAVPELQALLPKAPPPLPITPPPLPRRPPQLPPTPPAPSTTPAFRAGVPAPAGRLAKLPSRRTWFMLGGGAALVLLVLLAFRPSSGANSTWAAAGEAVPTSATSSPASGVSPADPAAEAVAAAQERARQAEAALAAERREQQRAWNRAHFLNYVSATVLPGYEVGTFGGISGGYIQFSNSSGYRLQNVLVAVQYIKASGDVYKTEYVTIDHLPAHQTTTQAVPDCGRGVQLSCSVYQLAAPGLDYTYDASQVE